MFLDSFGLKYSRLNIFIQKIDPNSKMPRTFMDSVDKSAFTYTYVISRNKLARLGKGYSITKTLNLVRLMLHLAGKTVIQYYLPIHNHMYQRVQHASKSLVSTRKPSTHQKCQKWHKSMMNKLKSVNVSVFLSCNKEKCIAKISNFKPI